MATQGVLVEAVALDEITTLVAPVRKDLDKDMEAARKAAAGDDPDQSAQGRASDRAEILQHQGAAVVHRRHLLREIHATYLHHEGDARERQADAFQHRAGSGDQGPAEEVQPRLPRPSGASSAPSLIEKTAALAGEGRGWRRQTIQLAVAHRVAESVRELGAEKTGVFATSPRDTSHAKRSAKPRRKKR